MGPGPLNLPGLGLMPGISTALLEEGGQEGQVAAEVPAAGLANVQRVRRAAVDISGSVAQEEQGYWHVGQVAGQGGLVAAAAGVGARLARGEVFGSHAGGVLEGDRGGGQQGFGHGPAQASVRRARSILGAGGSGTTDRALGGGVQLQPAGPGTNSPALAAPQAQVGLSLLSP